MERETGFAGQRSWPSACGCVAANRRPSAWETEPRVRSDAYLQLLPCRELQIAAKSGICDGSRLYPAPGFRGREGRWSPRFLYSLPERPPIPRSHSGSLRAAALHRILPIRRVLESLTRLARFRELDPSRFRCRPSRSPPNLGPATNKRGPRSRDGSERWRARTVPPACP